jgi:hypothetical protein
MKDNLLSETVASSLMMALIRRECTWHARVDAPMVFALSPEKSSLLMVGLRIKY